VSRKRPGDATRRRDPACKRPESSSPASRTPAAATVRDTRNTDGVRCTRWRP
jgi:hypothetical protein